MVPLASLWLPILLSAVLVFVVSSVLHMVLTYHRADYRQLPREDETLAGLRQAGIAPGYYVFPYCPTAKAMSDPALQERYKRGPVGILAVLPNGMPNMGRHLALWFGFCLLTALFVAYLAGRTLASGESYLTVFRVAGAAAFLAFAFGEITDSIWKGQPWSNTVRGMFDGLVYSLVMAGTFGWLWPS
jgi:hypothetical protein